MGNKKSVATMPGSFPETPAPSRSSSPIAASNDLADMPPAPAPASPTTRKARKGRGKTKKKKKKEQQQQQQQQQQEEEEQADEVDTPAPTPAAAAAVDLAPPPVAGFDPLAPAFVPSAPAPLASSTADRSAEDPFDFGRPILALKCRLQGCGKQTSPDDGESVACPACGVASLVRYCGKQHLYDDLRRHFLFFCGRSPVAGPVAESSVAPVLARQPRPYLRDAPGAVLSTIEHHRQAVYFAMEGDDSGDYFLFADSAGLTTIANPSAQQIYNCRGTGKLVAKIKMPASEDIHDHRQQRFRLLVARCLTFGATNEAGKTDCVDLAAMVRQELIERGEWNDDTITHLTMGMKQEFEFQLPEKMMQ